MSRKNFLYFGIATVVVEWIGLVLGFLIEPFNPNMAISTASVGIQPLPIVFGVTLSIAGLTYYLFSLALRPYSRWIHYYAMVAGIAFALTGWLPYTGTSGLADVPHQLCSYVALVGYIAVIWALRQHPKSHIAVTSRAIAWLIIGMIIMSVLSDYFDQKYFAITEILILVLIQTWTVFVVWHERRALHLDITS